MKSNSRCEVINVNSSFYDLINICNCTSKTVSRLLECIRSRFSYMITRKIDRVDSWCMFLTVINNINYQAKRWLWGIDICTPSHELLEDLILYIATQYVQWHTLFFSHCHIHGQNNGCRCIDCEGGCDLIQRNTIKEDFHILKSVYCYPNTANVIFNHWIIRIIPHLCG